MKLHLSFILGIILTGAAFAAEKTTKEDTKPDSYLDEKDAERKSIKADLDKIYKKVPTALILDNSADDDLMMLLSIDSPEKATAAAKTFIEKNEKLSEVKNTYQKEISEYFKNIQNTPESKEISSFTIYARFRYNIMLELLQSIQEQGLMTQELATLLKLPEVKKVPEVTSMSPELKSYWDKAFSVMNKSNLSLFSLKEKKDIPRVTKELMEIKKDKAELRKIQDKLYPLKSEADKTADEIMTNKMSAGPIRIGNVMLGVLDSRGFIKTNDPDMKDISKLIGEVTR